MPHAACQSPVPTRTLEQARRDLADAGVCVLPSVLDADRLRRARDAIYRAAEDDRQHGLATEGFALDRDANNRRVWNLLNRDPVFVDLAEHPLAVELVRATLGWPALLSNISGNITGPGAAAGVLHADQIFVPEPWPERPQGVNIAWCIDEFTEESGATRIVPESHRFHRSPREEDAGIASMPLLAPAGSLVAFESRIWHQAGANTTTSLHRAAVFAFYTTPIYRTQENWFLSLSPGVVRNASDTLLTLLAYKSAGFGLVYGASPR